MMISGLRSCTCSASPLRCTEPPSVEFETASGFRFKACARHDALVNLALHRRGELILARHELLVGNALPEA